MARRKKGFVRKRRYGLAADVIDQIGDWREAGKDYFSLHEMIVAVGKDPTNYKHRTRVYGYIHKGVKELVGWIDKKGVHEGYWDAFLRTKEYKNAKKAGLNDAEIWALFIHEANSRGIYVYIGDIDSNYYQPDYVSFHAYRNEQLKFKSKALLGAMRVHETIGEDGLKLPSGKTMKDLALPVSQTKGLLTEHMGTTITTDEQEIVDKDIDEIKEQYLAYYVRAYDDVTCPYCHNGKLHTLKHGGLRCDECKTIIEKEDIDDILGKK